MLEWPLPDGIFLVILLSIGVGFTACLFLFLDKIDPPRFW